MRALIVMAMLMASGSAFAAGQKGHRPPSAPPVTGVVNLNTATLEQLELLPGVGPSRAKAIVAYRQEHHFLKAEQVRGVKGVGKGVFKKMQAHVTVSGPTTIARVGQAQHDEG